MVFFLPHYSSDLLSLATEHDQPNTHFLPLSLLAWDDPTKHHLQQSTSCHTSYSIDENDKHYQVTMDIPGIKPSDVQVTVERAGGIIRVRLPQRRNLKEIRNRSGGKSRRNIHHDRAFRPLDPIVVTSVKATTVDGVLTVTANKKTAENDTAETHVEILVPNHKETHADDGNMEVGSENDKNKQRDKDNEPFFHVSMDLPGVAPNDLTVKMQRVRGGAASMLSSNTHVHVEGARRVPCGAAASSSNKSDSDTIKKLRFEKTVPVPQMTDMDKLQATLEYGVLTIAAPKDPAHDIVHHVPVWEGEQEVKMMDSIAHDKDATKACATEQGETSSLASTMPSKRAEDGPAMTAVGASNPTQGADGSNAVERKEKNTGVCSK